MPSLKSIKKRITSVKNTRQITKAMKMVSAAKLRRAQDNIAAAKPYARKLAEVLERLSGAADIEHPLLQKRMVEKALLIVVTSDRGLCGGFNANIVKAAQRFFAERKNDFHSIEVVTIGRKGYEFLKNRRAVSKNYAGLFSSLTYEAAASIAQEVIEGYVSEQYDQVFILYNAFRSVISQDVTLEQLLPIEPKAAITEGETREYIYEPSQAELLADLLPKHLEVQVFKALLDSVAAEHGARMSAMDSASKNASEMIGKLTLQYNRARQAAITKELMEIISGAESVKG
ncbi:MAG TPA: ATP synthase F1 subunit gamma [Verrucomicrobiae bacterium]|nr:ATP synthase F1 subunit gamma [Verrucomicrobiae bacterium]